jgi:hypothetical protein
VPVAILRCLFGPFYTPSHVRFLILFHVDLLLRNTFFPVQLQSRVSGLE